MNSDKKITAVFKEIPPPPEYTLNISVEGKGNVTADRINCPGDCNESYIAGTLVTLTAEAESGYQFDHWEGDITGTDISVTVAMNSDKKITAVFIKIPVVEYTLNVSVEGKGNVTADRINCPGDCNESYIAGTLVTLTAEAESGYQFDHWEGDITGTDISVTFVMNSDKSITAVFTEVRYTLNVSAEGNGKVTAEGINCHGDCNESYIVGTVAKLTAKAESDYQFVYWEMNVQGNLVLLYDNPLFIIMDEDKEITAVFIHETDNSPPDKPIPVSPAYEAVVNEGTVTLQASLFSDPEGDTHIATRWQVRRFDKSYENSIFDDVITDADEKQLTTLELSNLDSESEIRMESPI